MYIYSYIVCIYTYTYGNAYLASIRPTCRDFPCSRALRVIHVTNRNNCKGAIAPLNVSGEWSVVS